MVYFVMEKAEFLNASGKLLYAFKTNPRHPHHEGFQHM